MSVKCIKLIMKEAKRKNITLSEREAGAIIREVDSFGHEKAFNDNLAKKREALEKLFKKDTPLTKTITKEDIIKQVNKAMEKAPDIKPRFTIKKRGSRWDIFDSEKLSSEKLSYAGLKTKSEAIEKLTELMRVLGQYPEGTPKITFKYKNILFNIFNTKEALQEFKTKLMPKSVTLDSFGLQTIYETLEGYVKSGKPQEGIEHLTELGKSVYDEGKTSLQDFTQRMKEHLGKLWNSFKDMIKNVYESVKLWNERLGERGSIGRGETAPSKIANLFEADLSKLSEDELKSYLRTSIEAGQKLYREGKREEGNKYKAKVKEIIELTRDNAIGDIAALKTKYSEKIEKLKREHFLELFKNKILARDYDRVKNEIVDYIKEKIPLKERGQFINMIKNAKTQKNMTKAFIRIDKVAENIAIKSAIGKLKDTISKLTEGKFIAVDYINKVKEAISGYELSGHSKKTLNKLRATQEYLNRARENKENTEMPQRILNKLQILGKIPNIENEGYSPQEHLTLNQIEALQKEVELLSQLGKTKLKSIQEIYKFEKEKRKNELLKEIIPIWSKEKARTPVGETITILKKIIDKYINFRNYIIKTRTGLKPMDALAEITGMTYLKDSLDLSFSNYLFSNDDRFEKLKELEDKLTEAQINKVGVYAIAKQEGGIQRLTENNKISIKEIEGIKLNSDEQAYYDFIRKEFEIVYPSIKKWARTEFNVDVGQVADYVSFHTSFNEMNDLALYDRFGRRPEEAYREYRTKQVEKGYIETRKVKSPLPLETDLGLVFRRHMDDVQYALHMSRDIKMFFEIVNSDEVKSKLGDVGSLAWLQYLDLMARKGGVEGAKRIARLDILRKNISVGVLAGRLASTLVQLNSFTDTAATIGIEWATKGAFAITSYEWRDFIMNNFPEVKKAVGDDIAFRDFDDIYFKKLAKIGMTPLQILDGLMRSTAIAGAYQKLAFEKGIEIDFKNPNKELIQEATKLMRYSQGSSFFKDQPLAITTGYGLTDNYSLNKTLLTFQSFMLNRYANMKRQIWRLGIKEGNYVKAITSFMWLLIIAGAFEEGLRRSIRALIDEITDDESKPVDFEVGVAINTIQSLPIAGQIASSLMYSSNPVPVINSMENAITGGYQIVHGEKQGTKVKGLIEMGGAVGSLAGIAFSSQLAQILAKTVTEENKKKKRR